MDTQPEIVFSERPVNLREIMLDSEMDHVAGMKDRIPYVCKWLVSRSDGTLSMDRLLEMDLDVMFMLLGKAVAAMRAGQVARGEIPPSALREPESPKPIVPDAFWDAFNTQD